jgi:hypothetical protein
MIKLDCLTNRKRLLKIVTCVFLAVMVWFVGLPKTTAAVISLPDSPSPHRPSGVLRAFNYADVTLTGGLVEEQARDCNHYKFWFAKSESAMRAMGDCFN